MADGLSGSRRSGYREKWAHDQVGSSLGQQNGQDIS